MTEADWQSTVVDLALLFGWITYHTRNSRGSDRGFPDLVMVRERVVFAELKTDTGKLTTDQKVWQQALWNAGAEFYVWRPRDFDLVQSTLRGRK